MAREETSNSSDYTRFEAEARIKRETVQCEIKGFEKLWLGWAGAPIVLRCDMSCVRGEGVQGVLTLICGGVAQVCHALRVDELKEQLGIEEVDGERQEGPVKEEGRGRVKENAPRVLPWMTM